MNIKHIFISMAVIATMSQATGKEIFTQINTQERYNLVHPKMLLFTSNDAFVVIGYNSKNREELMAKLINVKTLKEIASDALTVTKKSEDPFKGKPYDLVLENREALSSDASSYEPVVAQAVFPMPNNARALVRISTFAYPYLSDYDKNRQCYQLSCFPRPSSAVSPDKKSCVEIAMPSPSACERGEDPEDYDDLVNITTTSNEAGQCSNLGCPSRFKRGIATCAVHTCNVCGKSNIIPNFSPR